MTENWIQKKAPPSFNSFGFADESELRMSTVSVSTFARPRFYLGIAAFMSLMVLVGFWPTYFGHLLSSGIPDRPWVVHLHGLVFVGWMVLLMAQVILVATGRTQAHRRL